MCGRYTHALTWRDIVELYRLTAPAPPPGWSPHHGATQAVQNRGTRL